MSISNIETGRVTLGLTPQHMVEYEPVSMGVMSTNGWKTRSVFDKYNITDARDIQRALELTEQYRRGQLGNP